MNWMDVDGYWDVIDPCPVCRETESPCACYCRTCEEHATQCQCKRCERCHTFSPMTVEIEADGAPDAAIDDTETICAQCCRLYAGEAGCSFVKGWWLDKAEEAESAEWIDKAEKAEKA